MTLLQRSRKQRAHCLVAFVLTILLLSVQTAPQVLAIRLSQSSASASESTSTTTGDNDNDERARNERSIVPDNEIKEGNHLGSSLDDTTETTPIETTTLATDTDEISTNTNNNNERLNEPIQDVAEKEQLNTANENENSNMTKRTTNQLTNHSKDTTQGLSEEDDSLTKQKQQGEREIHPNKIHHSQDSAPVIPTHADDTSNVHHRTEQVIAETESKDSHRRDGAALAGNDTTIEPLTDPAPSGRNYTADTLERDAAVEKKGITTEKSTTATEEQSQKDDGLTKLDNKAEQSSSSDDMAHILAGRHGSDRVAASKSPPPKQSGVREGPVNDGRADKTSLEPTTTTTQKSTTLDSGNANKSSSPTAATATTKTHEIENATQLVGHTREKNASSTTNEAAQHTIAAENYSLPTCGVWGNTARTTKSPNLDLLYNFFHDDVLGERQRISWDELPSAKDRATALTDAAFVKAKNGEVASTEKLKASSANHEFVQGLDDIGKLFEDVDVPDELDVGAGGSQSLQEVLVRQGTRIVLKRIALCVAHVQKAALLIKETFAQRFIDADGNLAIGIEKKDVRRAVKWVKTTSVRIFHIVKELVERVRAADLFGGGDDDIEFKFEPPLQKTATELSSSSATSGPWAGESKASAESAKQDEDLYELLKQYGGR
jgi:hypothetical protein